MDISARVKGLEAIKDDNFFFHRVLIRVMSIRLLG